jgi:hypothetical protein
LAVDGTGESVIEVELSEMDVDVRATSEVPPPQAASTTTMPARAGPSFFPIIAASIRELVSGSQAASA